MLGACGIHPTSRARSSSTSSRRLSRRDNPSRTFVGVPRPKASEDAVPPDAHQDVKRSDSGVGSFLRRRISPSITDLLGRQLSRRDNPSRWRRLGGCPRARTPSPRPSRRGARRGRVVPEEFAGQGLRRRVCGQVRLGEGQPQPHTERQRDQVRRGTSGRGPWLPRLWMLRYEQEAGVCVGRGQVRTGQGGVQGRTVRGKQCVQGALEDLRGQTVRDGHGLASGGREQVGERAAGCRLPLRAP